MKRTALAALLAAAALAAGLAPARAAEPRIALRAVAMPELPWRGLPKAEAAGQAGAILYPAPGLAGFLAAIATHGAMVEGARSAERNRLQKAADEVLEPYRPLLSAWTPQMLLDAAGTHVADRAVRVLEPGVEPAGDEWLVEVAPSFALTPDQGTLLLDNVVRITRPAADALPPLEQTVRVLSGPAPADAAQAHWLADEGKALKAETAAMVAHALEVALALPPTPPGAADEVPFKSHRYLMGADEKVERSQLLASSCGRAVLRTLRGHLLSVATRPQPDQPPCTAPYAVKR